MLWHQVRLWNPGAALKQEQVLITEAEVPKVCWEHRSWTENCFFKKCKGRICLAHRAMSSASHWYISLWKSREPGDMPGNRRMSGSRGGLRNWSLNILELRITPACWELTLLAVKSKPKAVAVLGPWSLASRKHVLSGIISVVTNQSHPHLT